MSSRNDMVHIYVYVYIYIYIYTYMYTYIYIYMSQIENMLHMRARLPGKTSLETDARDNLLI
jgi:hypothetical protein